MISWSRVALLGLVLHAGCRAPDETLDFSRLEGDARLWESEHDIYPKYALLFPEVPSDGADEYTFRVSGLPQAELSFGVSVASEVDRDFIRENAIQCECEVSLDGQGTVLSTQGVLDRAEQATEAGGWHRFDGYWIDGMRRPLWYGMPPRSLEAGPDQRYVIRIKILDPTRSGRSVRLTPLIWGGGARHRSSM